MSLRLDAGGPSRIGAVTLGEIFEGLFGPDAAVRFSAYDGSAAGRPDAPLGLRLTSPRGVSYLATAPGSLGLARAYIKGDLDMEGVHPGDPYEMLKAIDDDLQVNRPPMAQAVAWARSLGVRTFVPPPVPEQEVVPWQRRGPQHSRERDASAISHHYDVSNAFYEWVLGPSMAYTCACYPTDDATLEQAQEHKFDLVARKLGLEPGMRLLDIGCGWGGMVRHAASRYGVRAVGVTLSREQASWARSRIEADGLDHLAEVRHADYRDVRERDFDAVSSIGLVEHIGVRNYPAYFDFVRSRLRPGGRLLNHGITRPDNRHPGLPWRGFIRRYVFPDGELTGSGDVVQAMEDAGLEVQHQENLRVHYARTLTAWCANLVEHWDDCVAEAGLPVSKVWGLYMAGSRLAFERNGIQLHQVLATRTASDGTSGYPLRPDFGV
ncbi:MAG: class I SAM-dependent methyltransferase [Actinomycetes bacterium]